MAEFFVGALDVGFGEVEVSPVAVVGAELREDCFQDGVGGGAGCLGVGDGGAEEDEVVAEGADVGGVAGVLAVAGDEGGGGVVAEEGVEGVDPGLGGGVDEVGEGVVPEEVAAEDYVGVGVVDDGIAAGVAGHGAQGEGAVDAEVDGRALGVGNVGEVEGFDGGALLGGDVGAEELEVLGALPGADVFLGEDGGSGGGEDRVAGDVVEVIVGVDDEADGEARLGADGVEEGLGGGGVLEGVDDEDAGGAEDEACVGAGLVGFGGGVVDGCEGSVAEVVQSEGRGGLAEGGSAQKSGQGGGGDG